MNSDPPEETFQSDYLKCPHCGHDHEGSWDLPTETGGYDEGCGETECGNCEMPILWSRSISVYYTGNPKPL